MNEYVTITNINFSYLATRLIYDTALFVENYRVESKVAAYPR